MERSLVVVSRMWHEPFIRIDVTNVGIGLTMTLDDFVQALEHEAGVPLRTAAERVVAGMKAETTKVV